MNPRRHEGLWGAILVTLGIGVILSIPLLILLVAAVAFFPAAHWTEWIQSPASILFAVVAFFPISIVVEFLSWIIAVKIFNSIHKSVVSAFVGFAIWFLVIQLVIQPIEAALLVTIAYAAVSYVLDKVIPDSSDSSLT